MGKCKECYGIHVVGVSVVIISIVGLLSFLQAEKAKGLLSGHCRCCLQLKKEQNYVGFMCLWLQPVLDMCLGCCCHL